jgi:hypothetical protein
MSIYDGLWGHLVNPLLSPLEGGNNNRTPYIPHTLGDLKIRGHPYNPGRRTSLLHLSYPSFRRRTESTAGEPMCSLLHNMIGGGF